METTLSGGGPRYGHRSPTHDQAPAGGSHEEGEEQRLIEMHLSVRLGGEREAAWLGLHVI